MLISLSVSTGDLTIPTTSETSLTYNGITYTLDGAHPVGYFYDGSPFIVSDSAGSITATTEPSTTLNGAVAYGMMKNPLMAAQSGPGFLQGFDGFYADGSTWSSLYNVPYDTSLNVDPGGSDAASWTVGERCTFVKQIRDPAKTSASAQFRTSEAFDFITVLDAAPPIGTVRPGHSGVTKTLVQMPENFTPRGYTLPASWGTVQSIINAWPEEICHFTNDLVKLRFWRLTGNGDQGYSASVVDDFCRMVYALNSSNATEVQRNIIMHRIIKGANDCLSVYQETGVISKDGSAGQGGIWWCILYAAGILTNNSVYINAANGNTQIDLSTFWIDNAMVGASAPGSNGASAQTYYTEHVGLPWVEPAEITSDVDGRYTTIGAKIVGWEVLAILGFDIGQGSYTNGAETILQGGGNNITNPYAAKLGLAARLRTWNPDFDVTYFMTQDWKDAWDQATAFGDFTPWTGIPEQPPRKAFTWPNGTFFSAGDGSITLDTNGLEGATETVTSRDFRHSLDGVQWIETTGIALVSDRYTKTNLLRSAVHWAGWRMQSATGAGLWSWNYPGGLPINSGSDVNKVTTTGSQSQTTPTYTGGTEPQIHAKIAPAWGYPEAARPVSGTLHKDDIYLVCGVGYLGDCFPAPVFSNFQWKRNGVNISGATSKFYTAVAADAGTDLTCSFDVSNGTNSISKTTAAVTRPALTPLTAGTLINTDFKGAFNIDYTSELSSLTSNGGCTVERKDNVPVTRPGVNQGGIYTTKTGGNPSATFDIAQAASGTTSYSISGQFLVAWNNDNGRYYIEILDEATTLYSEELNTFEDRGVFFASAGSFVSYGILDFSGQFTTGASTALTVRLRASQPTGGTSGGDMGLTQLTIAEV